MPDFTIDQLARAMLIIGGYYESPSETKPVHELSTIMAELPTDIACRIQDWSVGAIPNFELYISPNPNNFGREWQIHVTVKHGLQDALPLDFISFVQNNAVQPLSIRLGKVSLFEEDLYDVVKIDVESQALRDLNQAITQAFNVTETQDAYRPHVTLAYVKKGMGRAHIGESGFDGLDVKIDRLIFSSKMGRQTVIPLYGVT